MAQFKNLMEVLTLLNKSNCRKCNEKTCMVFAAEVFKGNRSLSDCPELSEDILEKFGCAETAHTDRTDEFLKYIESMQDQLKEMNYSRTAECVGGTYSNGLLTLSCLGKPVSVDRSGRIVSEIHVNPWFAMPFYSHLIHATDKPLRGKWVPLRELAGGRDFFRLFGQRCEKPLKKIADDHTELFEDLVRLFKGEKVENHYEADISLVLRPFPTVPILICYLLPEEGMSSDLNVFFDEGVEEKLPINALYTLGAGIVNMIEKIALRHWTV
jgi:hypothetical protein